VREPIVRVVTLDAPLDDVWDALIRPERLGAWFGAEVELEARAGAPIAFRMPDGSARRGIVEAVEPPRSFAFRWRAVELGPEGVRLGEASRVSFELEPLNDRRTAITVIESPGILAPDAEAFAEAGR
jgi:uncharacterized protein YndB with AHSA1/START domain